MKKTNLLLIVGVLIAILLSVSSYAIVVTLDFETFETDLGNWSTGGAGHTTTPNSVNCAGATGVSYMDAEGEIMYQSHDLTTYSDVNFTVDFRPTDMSDGGCVNVTCNDNYIASFGGSTCDFNSGNKVYGTWHIPITPTNCTFNETTMVQMVFSSAAGTMYIDCTNISASTGPPAPSGIGIEVNITHPKEGQNFGVANFTNFGGLFWINGTYNTSSADCIINDTRWTINSSIGGNFSFINNTALDDGNYSVNVTCNQSGFNASSIRKFFLDNNPPQLITTYLNNTMVFNKNLTGQFNFTDNIFLHGFNVSIDGLEFYSQLHIHATGLSYNLSRNVTNLSIGNHSLQFRLTDGHTAAELRGDYDFDNGLWNDYSKYTFPEGGFVKTTVVDKSIFDTWTSKRERDRYTQVYVPSNPKSTIKLIETSSSPIYIYEKPGSYKGSWIVTGDHWKDYVLKNEPNSKVNIKQLTDYSVEVTISGIENPERLEFESIGDVNIAWFNFTFWTFNLTSEFDNLIFEDFPHNVTLDVRFGNLSKMNFAPFLPTAAILEWNGVNFTAELMHFNETGAKYNKSFSGFEVNGSTSINHLWHFNFSNLTTGYLKTNSQSQTQQEIIVTPCNATVNFTIFNMSYYDENNNAKITTTNGVDLRIFDGTFFYNISTTFSGHTSDSICANIDPGGRTYNWDLWGSIKLEKLTYTDRLLEIDEGVPFMISNNPALNLSLFMIKTVNSSTVTFNWFTNRFEVIDGVMRVFRCSPNGTEEIIESVPVTSGVGTANLELLTQTYFYDIIIGGVLFRDPTGFSRCQVESQTTKTFFVDVDVVDVGALIGLSGIPCSVNRTSNNTVEMKWGPNPEDTTTALFGCIRATRQSVTGNIVLFDNCTEEADFTRSVIVNHAGNIVTVAGRLEQGNNSVYCAGTATFTPQDDASSTFSFTGLLAAFFLVAGIMLLYAGENETQLVGAGLGIIVAFWLGILNYSPIGVSSIILFLILIAITGRYTRKR